MTLSPVPLDPELEALSRGWGTPAEVRQDQDRQEYANEVRRAIAQSSLSIEDIIGDRKIEYEDRIIPGPVGCPDITVAILRPRHSAPAAPAVYHIHGGGMIAGNRFFNLQYVIDWICEFNMVCVSVEYRLAPEHPHPAPMEDCYTGLLWTIRYAAELGIDAERVFIAGGSGGGGLAAAIALVARDRSGPKLKGQMLICPMLDDRNETVSSHQYEAIGIYPRRANVMVWSAVLGEKRGQPDVSTHAAPGRATDLSGLPPAFIDAGSAEVFRDEDVNYAMGIWASGGQAELHVWSGGLHGFDFICPTAALSKAAIATRLDWVRRMLRS